MTFTRIGIERRCFTAGTSKAVNDPLAPLDPKNVEIIQNLLNQIHETFKGQNNYGIGVYRSSSI